MVSPRENPGEGAGDVGRSRQKFKRTEGRYLYYYHLLFLFYLFCIPTAVSPPSSHAVPSPPLLPTAPTLKESV